MTMASCPPPPKPYIVYVDNQSPNLFVSTITEHVGSKTIGLVGFVRPGSEEPIIVYTYPGAEITIKLSDGREKSYGLDDASYCGSRGCTYNSP